MKIISIILLLLASNLLFGQISNDYVFVSGADTNRIAFMYAGSDTLEYMTQYSAKIKVVIDTIIHKQRDELFLRGRMMDAQTGESLGDKGIIILGLLEHKDKIWLRMKQKGVIKGKAAEYRTENGQFSIYIKSKKFPESFLFTALGCGIVDVDRSVLTSGYLQYKFRKSMEETKKRREPK